MEAEDTENPSRQQLYSIYNSLKDLHVKSQIRTSIFKVISQPWVIVNKDNEPQKELTELFQKKWFNDLNEHIISTGILGAFINLFAILMLKVMNSKKLYYFQESMFYLNKTV